MPPGPFVLTMAVRTAVAARRRYGVKCPFHPAEAVDAAHDVFGREPMSGEARAQHKDAVERCIRRLGLLVHAEREASVLDAQLEIFRRFVLVDDRARAGLYILDAGESAALRH